LLDRNGIIGVGKVRGRIKGVKEIGLEEDELKDINRTHGSLHNLSLLGCGHDHSLRSLRVRSGVPGNSNVHFTVEGEVGCALDLGPLNLGEHHGFALFANVVPEDRICIVAVVLSTTTPKQPAEVEKGKRTYSLGSISLSLVEAK
jgi:hypothetical protein